MKKVFYIEKTDDDKLQQNRSSESHQLSLIENPEKGKFNLHNIKLSELKTIGMQGGYIIRDKTSDEKRYNLQIDATDLNSLKKSLDSYGLKISEKEEDVQQMVITFEKYPKKTEFSD